MLSPYIKTSASAAEFESMLEPLMWLPQASSQLQFYALGIEGRPQHWWGPSLGDSSAPPLGWYISHRQEREQLTLRERGVPSPLPLIKIGCSLCALQGFGALQWCDDDSRNRRHLQSSVPAPVDVPPFPYGHSVMVSRVSMCPATYIVHLKKRVQAPCPAAQEPRGAFSLILDPKTVPSCSDAAGNTPPPHSHRVHSW